MKNQLGYDTRSTRSALVMAAIDAIAPWKRPTPFRWGASTVVSSIAGLGDLFIHLPLIAGIVDENTRLGIPVQVALRPGLAPIGTACGWNVILFDNALAEFFKTPLKTRPSDVVRRLLAARRTAPDLWIDLSANAVNAALIKLAGARRLAARITRGGRSLTDHPLPHTLQENEYTHCEGIASYLGCRTEGGIYQRLLGPSPEAGATVLALTTACRWRNWPIANFLQVAKTFPERRFVTVGFAREVLSEEQAAFDELIALPNVVNRLDRLNLLELIRLIAHAPAVLTNDTSTAHIANAFNRPGAVLFGPENSRVFASPTGLRVFHDESCPFHPCIQWTCRNPSEWCMTRITAAAVIEYFKSLRG